MKTAYQTMRSFWLDVKNLQHKEEFPVVGDKKICVAGVEMAVADEQNKIKHILIAAASLGNASIYFENNSPSGIGGFTGGGSSGPIKEKAKQVIEAAAAVADKLEIAAQLEMSEDPSRVSLFALGADGQLYTASVLEAEVRKPEHPLYAFFAYTQQLLGVFREQQQAAGKPTQVQEETQTPTEETGPEKKNKHL